MDIFTNALSPFLRRTNQSFSFLVRLKIQLVTFWSMRWFLLISWRFVREFVLQIKLVKMKVDIFVCFLKNQTIFKATGGSWLRSMISHFYGLRLVHLGMPHSASFLPQNSPVMSFGTYAFKGFLPLLPIFCHLFTAERLQLLCWLTKDSAYILKVSKAKLFVALL